MPNALPADKKLGVVFMVKLTTGMREQIEALAEKEGCSISAVIRKAINQYADREDEACGPASK